MIVADTDVLIDYLAGVEPAADRVAAEIAKGSLATTAVSRFELLAGAREDRQKAAVSHLLDAIPCYPLDDAAADRAATIGRDLGAKGAGIGAADCLIAGIVLSRGATLLTGNRKRFERVDGIEISGD